MDSSPSPELGQSSQEVVTKVKRKLVGATEHLRKKNEEKESDIYDVSCVLRLISVE